MFTTSFSSLPLQPEILENLHSMGYTAMTPIQAQSLPAILEGKDVIGEGKTGSGKTAAFGLGILQHLNVKQFRVQSLVLCPTRELAEQVANELRKLARTIHNIKVLSLCGGMPLGLQIGSLEHGAHIIVGTPGRIEEHLRKGTLKLDDLKNLVLDEADRMLAMGFKESLDEILSYAPSQRQTLLFSATFPEEIASIAKRVMKAPLKITVAEQHNSTTITQHFYNIDRLSGNSEEQRLQAIQLLLCQHRPTSSVIFCNTKRETQDVAQGLADAGFQVIALHGDLEQRERDQALVQFANKSISVLVATDVAARGLDIEALDLVINHQIARESEVHTQRIGRTGRAGNSGTACTLFSEKERFKIERLQTAHQFIIDEQALPPASVLKSGVFKAPMVTLQIDAGKKQKVRAGDILGALTGEFGLEGKCVGKIQLADNWAFVAVESQQAHDAMNILNNGKLKGRAVRARRVGV